MKTTQSPFYSTIYHLRKNEELIIYDKLIDFSIYDENLIKEFLAEEYKIESKNFPFISPRFDADAAYWSAKTFYTICQLVIFREHKEEELDLLFSKFENTKNASAILSVDLCLRFLPLIQYEATLLDPDDKLLIYIKNILNEWVYSSLGHIENYEVIDLTEIENNDCLNQLFIDRIIDQKALNITKLPNWNQKIKATMGDYQNIYWKELNLI